MKDIVPSMDEIKKVKTFYENSTFEELKKANLFENKRNMIILKDMTELLMKNASDEAKEDVWKFCKKLDTYAHCPITLAEYRRMKAFTENEKLVDTILKALKENRYPFSDGKSRVEHIQGYYYCIALLSQSEYRRKDCLACIAELFDYFNKNMPQNVWLLKRNIDVLKKDYADLVDLMKEL